MKRLAIASAILALATSAVAAAVAPQEAVERVAAWLARPGAPSAAPSGEVRTFCCGDEMLYHLVGLACGGYVALAADGQYGDVLGFTTEGELPPGGTHDTMVWDAIVGSLCSKKPAGRKDGEDDDGGEEPPEFTVKATRIEPAAGAGGCTNAVNAAAFLDKVAVAPLVKSRWDQEYVGGRPCFNWYTPRNCLCGCVATAMAQIMRYHEFPTGTVARVTRRCRVFGRKMPLMTSGGPYEWSKMPLAPTASATDDERKAIGRLCMDAAIAMKSTYTEWWTAASGQTVHVAMTNAFGFAAAGAVAIEGSEENLRRALLDELDAGRPCVVSVYGYLHGHETGHMVIADGYGWRGGKLYCHFNMGQEGMWDYWTLVEPGGRVASLDTVTWFHPGPAPGSAALRKAARIDEIAAWLPDEPSAPGARIGDRAAWDRLAALPSAAARIKAAEKALAEPIPELPDDLYLEFSRNGNRRNYERPYHARVSSLSALLIGECLENKGRFLPAIVARVKAIAAERCWSMPAHDRALSCFNGTPHVDLGSAHRTLVLAFVHDWLRDVLPQDVKDLVLAECERRTFRPYLATSREPDRRKWPRRHWWYEGENNWNSVCNSCVVRAALAVVGDRRLRAEFVASAEHTVPFAMKGYTDDGYCSEGMGYWNYGYGHHLALGLAVRAATGGRVDLFSHPRHRAVMKYPYGYRIMEWKSPHFADGGGNPDVALLALQRQVFPDISGRRAAELDLLAGNLTSISLRAFGQDPGPGNAGGLDELPARTWFPDAQVLISRGEWPKRKMRLGVAVKGGHNAELHNHNDVGSYAIMLDGVEMGGDPGGEVYTGRTFSKDRYVSKVLNSYGHPVPVVGGRLQKTGRGAAAKVLRADFADEKDVLELDCTAAYDVPALKSLVRTVTFDRANATVTVTDRAEFSEPTAFEVPAVTYREWTANADATEFSFSKSPTTTRRLKMSVRASAPVEFREEKIENPGKPDVTRLAFAFAKPATSAVISLVYGTR